MGLSIHSVPYILPIAALMCAKVSSGLITRTFHQPFSIFLALRIIVLVFGYSEATYTSYTQISPLHNKLACGYFLIKYSAHSHQLREIRIQLSIILKASITPATRVLPLLALISMPLLRVGSSSSLARNSRYTRRSVSTSILVRCLPPFPKRLDIPSHRMFIIEF